MAIEYLGLSEINGPMIVVEGVKGAFYDEIVEFGVEGADTKLGRIVEINEDKAVIQVFESTAEMSLLNTRTRLTGPPRRSGCPRIFWEELSMDWESRSTGLAQCVWRKSGM